LASTHDLFNPLVQKSAESRATFLVNVSFIAGVKRKFSSAE